MGKDFIMLDKWRLSQFDNKGEYVKISNKKVYVADLINYVGVHNVDFSTAIIEYFKGCSI